MNFSEALDFLTGIFGLDLKDDDSLEPMTEKDNQKMLDESRRSSQKKLEILVSDYDISIYF